jgi:hypothetical protein
MRRTRRKRVEKKAAEYAECLEELGLAIGNFGTQVAGRRATDGHIVSRQEIIDALIAYVRDGNSDAEAELVEMVLRRFSAVQ